jgi:hypothetical protein
MLTVFKFTHPNLTTDGGFRWTVGEWFTSSGKGERWSAGWLPAHQHPLLAEFHDPIQGKFGIGAILWRSEAEGDIVREAQLLLVATRMRILTPVTRVIPTMLQRVAYGILTSLEVYPDVEYRSWAAKWLSGEDRSAEAAVSTAMAAFHASTGVEATDAEASAAYCGVCAADAAERVAEAEAYAAYSAERAAEAGRHAADAARYATQALAERGPTDLNLIAIARRAMASDWSTQHAAHAAEGGNG